MRRQKGEPLLEGIAEISRWEVIRNGVILAPPPGSHSACEVMSLVDAEAAADLLAAFLEGLTGADLAALAAPRPL